MSLWMKEPKEWSNEGGHPEKIETDSNQRKGCRIEIEQTEEWP